MIQSIQAIQWHVKSPLHAPSRFNSELAFGVQIVSLAMVDLDYFREYVHALEAGMEAAIKE
jgi:hypothetical protein